MDKDHLLNLINKYLANQASAEEERLLLNYYDTLQKNELSWDEFLMGEQNTVKAELYDKILDEIKTRESVAKKPILMRTRWFLAASITLFLSLSALLVIYLEHNAALNGRQDIAKQIIAPGSNKAILTLANGSKITLDSLATGQLAKQAGVTITKTGSGQLVYTIQDDQSNATDGGQLTYNTIETPKGGQYQVNLPDGSRVWLNAASSLRYPTNFTGKVRSVQLSGEAYFEVAKNAAKPFKVFSNNQVIEVLGTHFNVSTYPDDASVRTTLLEGSVKVLATASNQSKLLKPGEQSNLSYADNQIAVQTVDTDDVVAWKNGYFMFVDEDLKSIMSKLSRWYNIDVEYTGNVDNLKFGGMVSRSKDLAQALKIIEQTESVKIKIEGRRVIIMP